MVQGLAVRLPATCLPTHVPHAAMQVGPHDQYLRAIAYQAPELPLNGCVPFCALVQDQWLELYAGYGRTDADYILAAASTDENGSSLSSVE